MTSLAAVSIAALSAVSVTGAGSDGLTDTGMMKDADVAGVFSGTARAPEDPDAPIRTARFDDTPVAPVELAGGPAKPIIHPAQVVEMASADARPAPNAEAVMLARFVPKSDPPPTGYAEPRVAAYARPAVRQAMAPSSTPMGLLNPMRRVSFSLTNESPLNPGSGLSFGGRDSRQNPAAQQIAPRGRQFDAKRLGLQVDVSPARTKKGRWFAFAATSGDALGFNFGDKGRKQQRWSIEKLAEYGKVQLGIGWRKGPMQISAAATQREIGAYGYSRDDTVFGLSFTVSGGKRLPAPKARRGIPRGD
ncbi:hypothetical protein [Caulobacter sp. NIBR1757]|uniref:hypothetical protein n=1 Tax=Caulobacter sp. NIBR1757 TaxID=3016000 RepID=UPI0022F13D55|nr:hypothetical protein [Caulobacter sp. NIBR1757]WGM39073.1 hypothetical protein AMEJIAPC_01986 [Caulobacter sp. NIBR1757]